METVVQKFFNAYKSGDVKIITDIFDDVKNNVDMNEQMLKATYNGNLSIVRCLHERGVAINDLFFSEYHFRKLTPLMIAAIEGHIDIVDYFLGSEIKNKVNVNTVNDYGWTALMYACREEQIDVVDRLLDIEDCDIHCKNNFAYSALFISVYHGHHEIVDKLLVNGANYYELLPNGDNLLHVAVSSNNKLMVERILLLGLDINHQNDLGYTPLINAVKFRFKEIVGVLVKNNANKMIKDNFGNTAFDYFQNHTSIYTE